MAAASLRKHGASSAQNFFAQELICRRQATQMQAAAAQTRSTGCGAGRQR